MQALTASFCLQKNENPSFYKNQVKIDRNLEEPYGFCFVRRIKKPRFCSFKFTEIRVTFFQESCQFS